METKLIESKSLYYKESRRIEENGERYIIIAEISLDDECKNKHCDWSVTGKMYRCNKNWSRSIGVDEYEISGAIGDEISKYMPELKDFADMHLNNYLGQPSYPVENGIYWLKENPKNGIDYLDITEEEAKVLSEDLEDRMYFKYKLFELGIVDRWKEKSDRLIKRMEEMTGKKWVNPYKPEEERFVLRMTDEEKREVEERIASGYYTEEAIQERIDKKRAEERKEIEIKYEKDLKDDIDKIERKRMVELYLFDKGIANAIYYEHSNTIEFNYKSWYKKISQEEFDEFVKTADREKLPNGITFKLK